MNKAIVALLWIVCSGSVWAQGPNDGFIMESEGMRHVIEHPAPEYPPIAKIAHQQGSVLLHVSVDQKGVVTKVEVVGGPSMFNGAAIDAVKKWTYRPFEKDGTPVAVQVIVSVPFSLGIPPETEKSDNAIGQAFFSKADECRTANATGHWTDAVKLCGDLVVIAERFPDPTSRSLEIASAHESFGEALAFTGQMASALEQFHMVTHSADKYLKPTDSEYADAYYWQAFAEHASHMPVEAERDYKTAESSYRKAMVQLPDMKAIYGRSLAHALAFHSVLVQQQGDLTRMTAMRTEAIALDPHSLDAIKGAQ
jgi:TonB family protein